MNTETTHPLKVFLCHASGDKPPVRDLYKQLTAEGIDAWLDQEKLLPGQDWRLEIPKAVREADVVVVCLSDKSITKEGYVQKEIKFALDIAEEKPEGTIFLIPARLEDCVVPERLSRWHWVDLYDENGFIKLLRSLKLRADAVGATIEPIFYEDSDKERERRLKQLYTEGLAAFYTEDWDRACHRFQSILSEQQNHKHAAEKLAEAERQRNLSKLYAQATEAVRSEDWRVAIQTLEELSQKSASYKDAVQLLRNARKQEQLKELYAEAKTLHEAQKWEAVVRVFDQISGIEPNYQDAEGLLPSAQKEVAELKRLADLNELYSNAVEEMDAGNWYEARRLLELVHKSQTGFLETEKLLKKVEGEIVREEERRRQNDQVNTLYEQAHGLLRSKKWRNALDKMEEIRKLDEHFPDVDGIAEKAQKELAREEQEAERQNKLAALYAEAVRLLKEEKYQEALDKWQEVRAVDPKYPDRQWVARTAKKELAKQTKPVLVKPRVVIPKSLRIGIVGLIAISVVITGTLLFGDQIRVRNLKSTSAPTRSVVVGPSVINIPDQTICASIQECQQLAEKAVEGNNPDLALDYFNLAISKVPSDLKPHYSGLWRDRADAQEQLQNYDEAQKDRDIWWLNDVDIQKIVFNSDRDGNREIYAMGVDGKKVVRLTFDDSDDWGPVWSPDGSAIAFTSNRSGNEEIYIMDMDGSNLRNLTNNPAVDSFPSWSPDGTKIAFQSKRRDGSDDIFVMGADGSAPTCLVYDDANDWGPTWSPDGRRITYSTNAFGDQEIMIVNLDGSSLQNLTNIDADDFFPSWSPVGDRITFTSRRKENEVRIYVLNLENLYVNQISTRHGWGSRWSPDGNQIVFTSYNDGHDNEIVLYDFRFQNITFLTNNDANDELPYWSPLP